MPAAAVRRRRRADHTAGRLRLLQPQRHRCLPPHDVRFSVTAKLHGGLRKVVEAIAEHHWQPIPYFCAGAAVAEVTYRPFAKDQPNIRLILRRVPPNPGSQLALFTDFAYQPFITDRTSDMLILEADHRAHAEIENAIRDLKYGVGLNHMPSGRFGANAAWLAINVIAHNLARWTTLRTRRRHRHHRHPPTPLLQRPRPHHPLSPPFTLHLPTRWPWADRFNASLTNLRAVRLVT